MKRKLVTNSNKGLTFIETILYVSILALMMTTLIPFAWNVIGSGTKSTTQQEVFSSARFIAQKIAYTIRNASDIASVASTSASFTTSNPATNPTVFDLSNGIIRIKEGTGSAIALNSTDTSASALLFINYSSSDGKAKNVQFQFTITAKYPSSRQEYTATTSIQSSAELRSN